MRIAAQILKYSRLVIIALLFVGLTITSPVFLTSTNLINVVRQTALLAVLGFAMTLVILVNGIDLSVGSVLALSSCLAAGYLKEPGTIAIGVAICLGVASFCGLLNGLMVAKVKLPPFIATYGMSWMTRGLALVFMGGNIVYGFPKTFRFLGAGYMLGIPTPIWVMATVYGLMYVILHKTKAGRNIYATGANREAAFLSGVKTDNVIIGLYTFAGFLVGLGALMYISRLNAAEPGIGESFAIEAIAATLIGGTPFTGGEGGISRTLMGAFILTLLSNGMNLLGISSLWQSAVFGSVIILAIMLERISKKLGND